MVRASAVIRAISLQEMVSVIKLVSDNPSFFMVFITVLSIMLPINAMTIDKGCHWNAYAACLPIPRSMGVLSKYVLAGLGILAAIIPCLVFRLVDRYTIPMPQ